MPLIFQNPLLDLFRDTCWGDSCLPPSSPPIMPSGLAALIAMAIFRLNLETWPTTRSAFEPLNTSTSGDLAGIKVIKLVIPTVPVAID
jgi:hypothetical protein